MTVKELINALLDCNMESDVKVLLNYRDENVLLAEDIDAVSLTRHNHENVVLEIKINSNVENWMSEWIEIEKA